MIPVMINSVSPRIKLGAVAATCAIAGVAAGSIADAGASTPATKTAHTKTARAKPAHENHALGEHRLRRLLGQAVAGSFVVDTKSGFVTVAAARGTVDSVSGDQLTLDEGTAQQTYKTVTLTLPSNVIVRDNRQMSALSQLTKGERVVVVEGPKRALVAARTAASASGAASSAP